MWGRIDDYAERYVDPDPAHPRPCPWEDQRRREEEEGARRAAPEAPEHHRRGDAERWELRELHPRGHPGRRGRAGPAHHGGHPTVPLDRQGA
eukprot:14275745-Alexandrium_andersonii.AAC.1